MDSDFGLGRSPIRMDVLSCSTRRGAPKESERLIGHLNLLQQASFIEIDSKGSAGLYSVKGLPGKAMIFSPEQRRHVAPRPMAGGALAPQKPHRAEDDRAGADRVR